MVNVLDNDGKVRGNEMDNYGKLGEMRWKNYGKLLGKEMEKLWELGEMRWKMIGHHGNVLEDLGI